MNKTTVPIDNNLLTFEYALPQGEVIIGELVQLNPLGEPMVDFAINQAQVPLVSISTISITSKQVGRKVVLMFNGGDLTKPIIIGLVHSPLQEMIENFELTTTQAIDNEVITEEANSAPLELSKTTTVVDGKKVQIEAQDEIILKCGESSITLTKAGKIMIRGKYLLNRSTGVNRILGGSVQVN